MKTFILDPLRDPRWERFVEGHPHASIFHTRGWLEALQRTYGYEPVVYTTSSDSKELENGLAFCRIGSWLTGRRLVSLPFSDHCEPLVNTREEWTSLMTSVIDEARSDGCKSVQTRPLWRNGPICGDESSMTPDQLFYLQTVNICSDPADLFRSFHRNAVQHQIKRAEKEGLSSKDGRSPELIRQFYRLLIRTRRRHRVPPQPLKWFENLVSCLGVRLTIRVASKDSRPIASILTLSFNRQVFYKYACTDERFHSLGGLQLLLWQAIKAERERGARILDMGRSEIEHTSLVTFKERWGSTRTALTYYCYPPARHDRAAHKWTEKIARYAFARLPDSLLVAVGGLLYRHMG